MYTLLLIIYLIACIALTIVILLQSSKGGGLAGAFGGGGGMGAVFGGRGAATFLSRVTTGLAIVFLLLALSLSLFTQGVVGGGGGLVEQEREKRSSLPAAGLPVVQPGDTQNLLPSETEPQPGVSDTTK
jgi:preprotein translocase subunit SecG